MLEGKEKKKKDFSDQHFRQRISESYAVDTCTADDTPLMAKSEEELKSLLMKVKESEKAGLKLTIQKTKITASGPITSQQIDGETMEKWQTLFWGAPKSLQKVTGAMKLKDAYSLEAKLWST